MAPHHIKIKARILSQTIKIVIDTGAYKSYIRRGKAQEIINSAATVSDIIQIEDHQIVKIIIQLGAFNVQTELVADEDLHTDLILGSDFLTEHKAIINYADKTLKLQIIGEIPLIIEDPLSYLLTSSSDSEHSSDESEIEA